MKGMIERQLSRKKRYVMKWKRYVGFAYLGDRMSTGGECEVAMTARAWGLSLWNVACYCTERGFL